MAIAYQYDAAGFFAGPVEDYGLLPNNATYTPVEARDGSIPRWTGTAWAQVENHTGKQGWVHGKPYIITEYGPLPDGWSETPPEPTPEELAMQRQADILARLKDIDAESVRPLRALVQGDADQADRDKLAALEAEAEDLRAELAALEASIAASDPGASDPDGAP